MCSTLILIGFSDTVGKNGPPKGQDAREEKGSAEKHLSGAAKETQVGISEAEGRQEVSKKGLLILFDFLKKYFICSTALVTAK